MSNPLFANADAHLKGAMTARGVTLDLEGGEAVLVQGFNFTWQQAVTRLYEISDANPPNVYHVGGRAQGQATLARVIGPSSEVKAMYAKYGEVCTNHKIELDIAATGSGPLCTGGMGYTLDHVVLVSVGVNVQAQDMVVHEQSQFMFSGCYYK